MNYLTQAARQALEALEGFLADYQSEDGLNSMKHYAKTHDAAITALRAALEAQQEPVAELLAELDGERARSQMYADLVRGVAVALRGPGYSDTSKLPQEVAALKAELDRLRAERDAAVGLLASWCVSVDHNGTGWDDWDEDYKDARYRPGPLREALDKAIAEERQHRGITGD